MEVGYATVNAAYYPSWAVHGDLPPSKLRVECLTHVFYAFARVNANGSLRYFDAWADEQMPVDGERGCLRAVTKLRQHHPRLRVLLSIGGGGGSDEFPTVAASARTRVNFAISARHFVDKYSLDGVDIDWEHPSSPSEGGNFLHLLRTLRTQLPEPEYLITATLPVDAYCLKNINFPGVDSVVDFVNLMGYDLAGPWTDVAGHHAQLVPPSHAPPGFEQSVAENKSCSTPSSRHFLGPPLSWAPPPFLCRACHFGVDYLIHQGVPRRKIVLGIPVYARNFPGATAPGHAFDRARSGEMDYRDLPGEWITGADIDHDLGAASFVDVVRRRRRSSDDPEAGTCHERKEDYDWDGADEDDYDSAFRVKGGKGFVSFDVPATVRQKAGYAKAMGLAGLFYWTGVGDADGPNSLVAAGWKGLQEL